MKTLLMLAALTLATSASALSISTPVLNVQQACPSMMNGFAAWLRQVWGNPWVVTN